MVIFTGGGGRSVSVTSSAADKNQTARRAHCVTTPADSDALLVTFELRAELPVLSDVLAASAAVPVADIAAAGCGQATYQLAAPDSFSYVFHGDAVTSPAPAEAGVHWSSTEQVAVYPPIAVAAEAPLSNPSKWNLEFGERIGNLGKVAEKEMRLRACTMQVLREMLSNKKIIFIAT